DQRIREIIAQHGDGSFSYTNSGITKAGFEPVTPGFNWDHNRMMLGRGEATFKLAIDAIKNWKMFDFAWSHLCWPDVPIETGKTVAAVFMHFGFWSVNLCRIVYTIDEKGPTDKFGF